MKNELTKIALAVLGFTITAFLSCSDNPRLDFPTEEDVRQRTFSSSSSESSSSAEESSSSSSSEIVVFSSSSDESSSSSSVEESSSSSSSETVIPSFSSSSSAQSSSSSLGESSSSSSSETIVSSSSSSFSSSSFSSAQSSSSSAGESSSSSSSEVVVSSSSSVQSSSSALKECEEIFNPANKFCYDGILYNKCDGIEYNPTTHICTGDYAIPAKCGIQSYNPVTQGCCNSAIIFPRSTQRCVGGIVETKCGSGWYNAANEFCTRSEGNPQIVPLCGGRGYDTRAKFCHGNEIYGKCSGTGDEYIPGTENCCGSHKYNLTTQFCYNSSNIGNFCGTRPETFDPDLYECREGKKIYLKTPVSYGGEDYEAVLIGTQTWMARNLHYNAPGSICGSRTYNDLREENTAGCDIYGRLYNWATAMDIASTYNTTLYSAGANHRGICPEGWHIPSNADWNILMKYVNPSCLDNSDCDCVGGKLKASSGWDNYDGKSGNGTDDYGFSALPGGWGLFYDNKFFNYGKDAHFRTTSEVDDLIRVYRRSIFYHDSHVQYGTTDKINYNSVRCVKN